MKCYLDAIALQFRGSREVITFGKQVSFFHGPVGTGKSSIGRLIDYCLGGGNINNPTLDSEFVAAELSARIGDNDVVLRRASGSPSRVEVTWRGAAGEGAADAPLQAGRDQLIEGEDVFGLSDLLFHLMGEKPVKVRKNKADSDAKLVRLGFRDFLTFCYLDQKHLDSTFFRLDSEGGMRVGKSRDVMRVVLGFYDVRLSQLQIQLDAARREALGKQAAAEQVLVFLNEQGLESADQISEKRESMQGRLGAVREQLETVRERHASATHFSSELRERLRKSEREVARRREAKGDLLRLIDGQQQLHAELISARFRLARSEVAAHVLVDAPFIGCPSCGQTLDRDVPVDHCQVCIQPLAGGDDEEKDVFLNKDIAGRLVELDEAIGRHQEALRQLQRELVSVEGTRAELDETLRKELEQYDTTYLSQARNLEREDSRLHAQLLHLDQMAALPEAARKMEVEAARMQGNIAELRVEIARVKKRLEESNHHVGSLEEDFKEALIAVGFPGVGDKEVVHIDRNDWMPYVRPDGDEDRAWSFENVHSGGKSTLFNVCFGLALHRTASELGLPLPTFLIIDGPMKNIDPEVNEDLFIGFYRYLYAQLGSSLRDTQIIIMDSKHVPPPEELESFERYMSLTDPDHPPLVPYFSEGSEDESQISSEEE